MNRVFIGEIREIIIGGDMNGVRFVKGHPVSKSMPDVIIHSIQEETNSFYTAGVSRYHIFVEDGEEIKPWKRIEGVGVIVTCEL